MNRKNPVQVLAASLVRKASRNYIAGPDLSDARRVSDHLADRGYWTAQGYWDDGQETPEQIQALYTGALDQMAGLPGTNCLAIKIPALRYEADRYASLLAKSRETGVGLHFDSLAPAEADRIHEFIQQQHVDCFDNTGCTLPGRWQRSLRDADRVSDLGLTVRVVKGQWEDPGPVIDPRAGYLAVIDRLAGQARRVRVASHDLPLVREALQRLKTAGTPAELELLYGLPHVTPLATLAREMGVPVRIYVPFGHAFLPYALSSLRRKPLMALKLLGEVFRANYLASFPPLSALSSLPASAPPPPVRQESRNPEN